MYSGSLKERIAKHFLACKPVAIKFANHSVDLHSMWNECTVLKTRRVLSLIVSLRLSMIFLNETGIKRSLSVWVGDESAHVITFQTPYSYSLENENSWNSLLHLLLVTNEHSRSTKIRLIDVICHPPISRFCALSYLPRKGVLVLTKRHVGFGIEIGWEWWFSHQHNARVIQYLHWPKCREKRVNVLQNHS